MDVVVSRFEDAFWTCDQSPGNNYGTVAKWYDTGELNWSTVFDLNCNYNGIGMAPDESFMVVSMGPWPLFDPGSVDVVVKLEAQGGYLLWQNDFNRIKLLDVAITPD